MNRPRITRCLTCPRWLPSRQLDEGHPQCPDCRLRGTPAVTLPRSRSQSVQGFGRLPLSVQPEPTVRRPLLRPRRSLTGAPYEPEIQSDADNATLGDTGADTPLTNQSRNGQQPEPSTDEYRSVNMEPPVPLPRVMSTPQPLPNEFVNSPRPEDQTDRLRERVVNLTELAESMRAVLTQLTSVADPGTESIPTHHAAQPVTTGALLNRGPTVPPHQQYEATPRQRSNASPYRPPEAPPHQQYNAQPSQPFNTSYHQQRTNVPPVHSTGEAPQPRRYTRFDRPNLTRISGASHLRRQDLEELPAFDGRSPEDWLRFEATFDYLVRSDVPDDDLVSSLNRSLKGEAYRIVEHLLIVRADPHLIMNELSDFYGDAKRVIARMTGYVIATRPMKGNNDPELLDLAIKVKRLVTNIIYFNSLADLESTYLIHTITGKLSDDIQDRWYRQADDRPDSNLEDLATFLLKISKQICARNRPTNARPTKPNNVRALNVHETEQEASEGESEQVGEDEFIDIGVHVQASRTPLSCYFCHENHRLIDCVQFLNRNVGERYELVNSKNICSCCLSSTNHSWRDCPKKVKCTLSWCKNFHHPLLHKIVASNKDLPTPPRTETGGGHPQSVPVPRPDPAKDVNLNTHVGTGEIIYGILPAQIKDSRGDWKQILVMIDTGAGATLIDKQLQEELGLLGTAATLKLKWTDDSTHTEDNSIRLQIQLRGLNSSRVIPLNNVQTVGKLHLPSQGQNAALIKNQFTHLKNIPLPSFKAARPLLLIGLPHVQLCFGRQISGNCDNEPVAIKTPLGWVILGPTPRDNKAKFSCSQQVEDTNKFDAKLDVLVERFFQLETEGVRPLTSGVLSSDEKRAVFIVEQTMKQTGNRYEIGLFWKHDNVQLPTSYNMAHRRLMQFEQKLMKQPELKQFVNDRLKLLTDAGHVRKATPRDLSTKWSRVWYVPPLVVIHPSKGKPRLVFDAAAEVNGVSLNTVQIAGPNLLIPLAGPLFRIRQYSIGVSGDHRDMFTQIRISEADQQCQRFLWRDLDTSREPQVYIHQAMLFGSKASPFSAQIVKNSHAKKYANVHPEAVDALINGTFVDDYADSRKTVEEAARVTNAAIDIMSKISLDLVNFQSNSTALLKQLPRSNVKPEFVDLDLQRNQPDNVVKILGLNWDTNQDLLLYRMQESLLHPAIINGDKSTKRQLLSAIMRIFDPLGQISHFTIQGRILLQDAWRSKISWDEHLPEPIRRRLAEWAQLLVDQVTKLRFQRCYTEHDPDEATIDLHIFTDASENAMGATAYFRIRSRNDVKVTQVMAKSKAMPLRGLSVPQGELVAAVMGARLAKTVSELHTYLIQNVTFWTDSKCVLAQLKTERKLKTFFAVRVNEILENTSIRQWRYVPSALNPADYATKWHADSLSQHNIWFDGPTFLKEPENCWPTQTFPNEEELVVATSIAQTTTHEIPVFPLLKCMKPSIVGKWTRLVKVLAFRISFILIKFMRRPKPESFIDPVTIKKAENYIFASIQADAFKHDYLQLKTHLNVEKNSKLYKLSPFLDEAGVIRLQSRLQMSPLTYSARNPAILPTNHPWVELLIKHFHDLHDHSGEEQIITSIRTKAWILNIRTAVRRVAKDCQECKNRRAKPNVPRMADLPICRVNIPSYPFEHTGTDVFGPIELSTGRKGTVKRWVIIFVCMTYRAVHLEMLYDMTADEVLQALEEFQATRGRPKHMYSDQGTNFKGAYHLLHNDLRRLRHQVGETAAAKYDIAWHFNPPYSPHFGGVWERLIKSIKSGLNFSKTVKRRPTERIFRRALKAVEGRMNARPLTTTPIDPDNPIPLTPNQLILGHSNEYGSPHVVERGEENSLFGYRRVKYLQQLMFQRWLREYLPVIMKRGKWFERQQEPLKSGDIALVVDRNSDRDNWHMVEVERTFPGNDGEVRVVEIRFPNNKRRRVSTINLARLEVKSSATSPLATGGGL